MKSISLLLCVFSASCCLPSDLKTETDSSGIIVASSRKKDFLIAYTKNDPQTSDSSLDVMANQSPLLTFHGLGSVDQARKYTQFYSSKNGFIYDRNLDGFPDEALMLNGKCVKLEVWAVDRNGNKFKKVN